MQTDSFIKQDEDTHKHTHTECHTQPQQHKRTSPYMVSTSSANPSYLGLAPSKKN